MSRIFGPFSALYDPQKHFQSFLKNLTRPGEFKFLLALCILQFTTRFCFCCDLYFAEVWVVRREGCNLIFFDKRTWHPDFGENFTPKPLILNLFHFSHFWLKLWVSMKTMKCKLGWWVFSFTRVISDIVIPFWTTKLTHLNLKRQKKSFSPFVSSLNTKGL